MERRLPLKDIIIGAEGMSLLVCIVVLYGNYFETKVRDRKRKVYGLVVLCIFVAMAADMVSWIIDGRTEYSNLDFHMTSASLYMGFLIEAAFSWYLYESVSEKTDRVHKHAFCIMGGFAIFCAAAIGLACSYGVIFRIEDGCYIEASGYRFYLAMNMVCIIFTVAVISFSCQSLGKHDSLALISYVLLPAVAIIINGFVEGFSMTYPATTLSMLITYIMVRGENETSLREKDARNSHFVYHDDLTGLLNRRSFDEQIKRLSEQDCNVGVLFSDINGLKYTNDNYGHAAGDKLIKEYSRTLLDNFRKEEVFRVSGDEFVVLLADINEEMMKLRSEEIRNTYNIYDISPAAIGYAYGKATYCVDIVRAAETDMYREKELFYQKNPLFRR